MKRIVSALLAGVMALGLASCGGQAASSAAAGTGSAASGQTAGAGGVMGRWVQQEVLTAEGMYPSDVYQTADGAVHVWMCETGEAGNVFHRYTAVDGVNFTEDAPSWLAALPAGSVSLTVLGNGDVLATQLTPMGEADVKAEYFYCAEGAQPQPVDWGLPEGMVLLSADPIGLSSVVVAYSPPMEGVERTYQSGNSSQAEGFILDLATGQKGAQVDFTFAHQSSNSSNGSPFASQANTGDSMMYLTSAADGVNLYELGMDGRSTLLTGGSDVLQMGSASAADSEKNYYQLDTVGITRLAYGGSLNERVVENRAFAYAQPDIYPYGLLAAQDGSFYMCALEASNEYNITVPLYRYVFDETLPAQSTESLTVWSLNRSDTVTAAIAEFAKTNPEIGVEYTVAVEANPNLSTADILSTLAAELLAGGGPDVILCDGFDCEPYVKQGIFADLSDVLNRADFKENLVSSFFTDEGVFVLPMRWKLPVIFGLPEEVSALTSLEAVQEDILSAPVPPSGETLQEDAYAWKEPDQQPAMIFTGADNLMDFVLGSSLPAIVTAEGVNEDNLRTAYSFIQAVGRYCQLPAATQGGGGAASTGAGGQPFILSDNAYFRAMVGNVRYGWADAISPGMLSDALAAPAGDILSGQNPGKTPVSAVVRPGLCPGAFTPVCLTAVNASSSKLETAKSFVQTMAGKTVQDNNFSEGMAVRTESLQAAIEAARADGEMMEYFTGDIQAVLDSAQTPVVVDAALREILLPHAQNLTDGSESVEDAVQGTVNDLSIYLAERR